MITVKEIEELFRNEKYEEASVKIREALQQDDENAELFYYLFLAENRDYANIDLNNIVNEMHFNKALDLAVLRLQGEFHAEYNFYHSVDEGLRKFFAYAGRGNVRAFGEYLASYDFHPAVLINDESSEKEFFSNLDYLVTSRVSPEIVDMNLISLNILYFATQNIKVLKIRDMLKERATENNTKLSGYAILSYNDCMPAFEYLTNHEKEDAYAESLRKSEEEKKLMEEAHQEETRRLQDEVNKLQGKVDNLESKNTTYQEYDPYAGNSGYRASIVDYSGRSAKFDTMTEHGARMVTAYFIISIIQILSTLIFKFSTNFGLIVNILLFYVLMFMTPLPIAGIVFGFLGRKSDNDNHSGKCIAFGFVDVILFFIVIIVFVVMAAVGD